MSQSHEEPLSGSVQEEKKEEEEKGSVMEGKDQGQGRVATGTFALLSGFVSVFV